MITDFFEKAVPTNHFIWVFTLPLILYIIGIAYLIGWMSTKKHIRVAYTRKTFHLCIFTMAAALQLIFGLGAVVWFGILVSCSVIFAVWKGDNFPFYEAMARQSDAPKRSLFIVVPLITTALGGVISNIFFGQFASIGYLVGGFGDAIGEPVGARWGKHRYNVLSIGGIKATRSYEGSTAVWIISFICAVLGIYLLKDTWLLLPALLIASTATLAEAISSHGLDNLTIQVVASGAAYYFFTI